MITGGDPLAKIDVPYVKAYPDRHGKMRYYFRRRGFKSATLPDPTDPAFAEAYRSALGEARPAATSITEGPRSLGALIAQYYLSLPFRNARPTTQRTYRSVLEPFRLKHGDKPAVGLEPRHLSAIFHAMAATPAQASNLRKRLKAVYDLGVELEWVKDNPVSRTKRIKYKVGGHTPWTEAEIAAYRARWPSGTRERLALEILLSAAERRSDAIVLGSQHYRGGQISVVQHKTDERLWIPCHPDLARELDRQDKTTCYLMTQYGLPFTGTGFYNWFTARARDAGVHHRSPHGLRHSMGRRLAEAGCSNQQIMAILGHASPITSQVYTRDVDRKKLADDGMATLLKKEG